MVKVVFFVIVCFLSFPLLIKLEISYFVVVMQVL